MNEGKFVWVISERTYLDYESREYISVFSTFEKARDKMREMIQKNALSENSVFDGQGGIVNFYDFIDEYNVDDEDIDPEFVEFFKATRGESNLSPVAEMLSDYFNSDGDFDIPEELKNFYATNHLIECKMTVDDSGEYEFKFGDLETDLKRDIRINTFKMNDPAKAYIFSVMNEFFEYSFYGKVDILLVRVDLDDWMEE